MGSFYAPGSGTACRLPWALVVWQARVSLLQCRPAKEAEQTIVRLNALSVNDEMIRRRRSYTLLSS